MSGAMGPRARTFSKKKLRKRVTPESGMGRSLWNKSSPPKRKQPSEPEGSRRTTSNSGARRAMDSLCQLLNELGEASQGA